jgi:hypothetical protein
MAENTTGFPDQAWTGTPGVNLTVPKPGQTPYNIPSPFGNQPTPNSPDYLNPSRIGKTAAETAANMERFVRSKVDYNNYAKMTAYDAGPNGADISRYKGYGKDKFYKIGFDPTIDNETKFLNNTTWWDDTKRMLTNSFLPLYGEGLKANFKSYLDMGDGDFGQDIRAAAEYEKASNIGYSTRGGIMPFISNTAMSYAYTGGILTAAVAETYLLRKMSPGVFGGKDDLVNLMKSPKDIFDGVKSTSAYLKDMKNVEVARSAFSKALEKGWNFINPINNSWDNFANNVIRNTDDISALARTQRTFGAFYKDIRNMNMALSEGRLEGGFAENNMLNNLYNDHYFRTGEVPDEATMKMYQEKAKAAGFSATMQNLALVYYTNQLTLPSLMKFGPFKALDNIGKDLAEGTLLREGSGLTAKVAYSPRNFIQGFKNLAKPATWGRGGLNYFKANLLEGVQENLQDVISESTQAYFTNSIFQPERGKFEMYMAGLKDNLAKQWSHQGLETFASGFLMGFGNTIVEGTVQNMLKAGNYLTKGKGYINYLNERHDGGQQLADLVNAGLSPVKFFGSREFDHGNQALIKKDIDANDTSEKEKIDSKSTSLISSVLAALETGTFDMYIDNLQGLKQMTEIEIEDTFKLKAGEGKKALERVDKIIEKANKMQKRFEYHNEKYQLKINVDDYKEGTIEREHAELMSEAHRRSKFNAIFLNTSYEDNLGRIDNIGKTFQKFSNYAKSDSTIMMSDLDAIYNKSALQSQIKLLESEIASMEGITEPEIVSEKERKVKLLNRLQKYDKVQAEYNALQMSKLNGSFAINEKVKEELLKDENLTDEDRAAIEESDEKLLKKIQEIEDNYKQGLKDYLVDLVGGDENYLELLRKAEDEDIIDMDAAFNQLKDLTKLDVENQSMLKYMSVLNDPAGYMEHVQRNYKWMRSLYATKKEHIRQMIEKSLQTKEYKDLLQSLASDGVYIDLDEFAKWIQDKTYLPKEFIDATKEMVIPKGSDTYMKYYQRFIQVAKAQEQRIADEKINKEQSLKDRTDELNKMKQKELDDARVVYLRELKTETGSTEAELIKALDEFIEKNLNNKGELDETVKKLSSIRTLLQTVNSPVLLASYYQIRDKAFAEGVLDQSAYDKAMDNLNNDEAQLIEVKKIQGVKTKSITNASPEDILVFSIDFYIVGNLIEEQMQVLTKQLELAEVATENPNIDPKDTKAYKLYEQRVKDIEERYKKALEESKEDIDNFDDDAPRRAQINVTTPWEQLPKELVNILQPKFEAYVAGKEVDEADMYDFRQNWLLTQNAEIQKFLTTSVGTSEKPLPISEKVPKLKTIPKEQQDQLDKIDPSNLSFTVGLRKILERKINTEKKEEKPTKQQKAAIEADIEELQKYINYQRSIATPGERLQSIADDFVQSIEELQKEVAEVVINGVRQNYILDQGKETETIPQRVTELVEEIETGITPEKPPYVYPGLNDPSLLNGIFQLIKDIEEGVVTKEGAIDTFINTIEAIRSTGKLAAFTESKVNDVRGLLYVDAVKRGILTKEQALASLATAKMSSTDYAKFVKEYEAPEKETDLPPPGYTNAKADVKKDRYYTSPVNRMVKVKKDSENTPITKEEEEEIEAVIEKAKELGWDKNRLFRQLSSMGYSYAFGVNPEGYRNYLEDRLSGKTNIKVTSEYNFFEQLDEELAALGTTDETDLEELTSPEETLDVSTILNIIGDVANQESSQVGITVDDMIRDFLAFNEPQMPSYMTKNHPAYQALFGSKGIITEIRDKVLEGKWTILSDHVKVFDRSLGPKDEDGKPMGLAGEVDLIYIDNETGEIEIIDIKTAKPANWTYWDVDKEVKALEIKLENKKAELANKENAKRESFIKKDIEELEGKLVSAKRKYSKKLNYSIQQTIYRNLVYRMTGKMPRAIKILPLSVDYTKDGVINKISIPTKVTDTDAKGNPGMFITLEPVNEVEKYVPIGKIKDTIEPGNEQEYKETEVVSNQIGYNLGKSFVYNGRVGTLIKNADGTYALDTPTEIIDISINGNNKISSEATIEIVGLTPVKIIQRPFTTTTINGVEHTITELDSEDDTIIVDGVKYKVTRTAKKKTVNGVEFMSNQKEIDEIDARIRDVSKDIVKRQQDGEREGEDVNTFTKNLAEAKIELEGLNEKRATLVGTNKIRKITGTNATDILFLINQSPEIFLQNPPKDIEEENEDLEDIRSLFPSDAAFQEVYQIMKNRPEALSRLINGEYTGTEQDIEAIKDWISKSIATLSFSKNDVSTAVLMLTKLDNEVELIKLTKNGKISKRQPKGLFERQNPEGRPRLGVPNVQEPGTGSAEGVSGQSSSKKGSISPQEGKQIIDGVKKRNQRPKPTLSQTLGTLGTDENIEGYEEIRERIMKADESELDSIEKDLFMKAIRQEISLSGRAIEELIAERRFQLQENATVKDVKKNQMVVSIAPVIGFDKDSTGTDLAAGSLFKVIKVSEKSVTLQYLDNKKIKAELSAAEFNKKFKPMPKETKPKTVKKPISKEYQAVSLDVAEELDKFAQNQANIQNIQDTFGEMTEDEADNAFMNAVKQCKTK